MTRPPSVFGKNRVLPIPEARITSCHSGDKPKAKLDLAGPRSLEQQLRAHKLASTWFASCPGACRCGLDAARRGPNR